MRTFTKISALVGSVVVAATAFAQPQYQIFDIGVVQKGDTASQSFGVSPAGVAVGRVFQANGSQAFSWTAGGSIVGLPNLAGRAYAVSNSANDSGLVVGTAADTFFGSNRLPVMWQSGVVTQLPLPPGESIGDATGVNSLGIVVGSVDGGSFQRGVIYKGPASAVITETTSTGCFFVTAFGINDAGRIVGFGIDPNNAARNVGIVLDFGQTSAFEVGAIPGANGALAFGVGNRGQVVGSSMMNQGPGTPFIWSEANGIIPIPLATGTSEGSARAVNSAGWVVGQDSSAFSIPFLWDGTTTYRIADLLPPGSGWDLSMNTSSSALGISDDGVIVGTGVHNGETHAYAMVPVQATPTPTPGPATHFAVTAPQFVVSTVPFSFTVTAQDSANNTVTGYTGIVHFTSSDGTATLPPDSTFTNGIGTFEATMRTVGTQTITATDTVIGSITGTSNPFHVFYPPATHFAVSAPANVIAGTPFNFTVTAQDEFNNTAFDYAGIVHFTTTSDSHTLPPDSQLNLGTSTFSAILGNNDGGNYTITATDLDLSITGTSNPIHVVPSGPTPTPTPPVPPIDMAVSMTDGPDPVQVGQDLTYTITVSNLSPDFGLNITMTDTLPADVNYVSAAPSQGSCTGTSTVTCDLGPIQSSATVILVVTPTVAGQLSNTANVPLKGDPNPANNSSTQATTVIPAGPTPTPASQTINLSTRMRVQTGDNVGIGGFIVTDTPARAKINGHADGSASLKHVLIRAIGPSLTQFGVPDALADPVLELHGPDGFVTITNDNWKDDPAQRALIKASGIPPTNDFESAIDAILIPGAYTAIVRGNNNTSGVALVEVYDLESEVLARLANISTRAFVDTGNNIVIAGFILGGNSGNDRIVVRGIGPSLAAAGVPDALADPTLELRDINGALVVANNDWQDDPAGAAELVAASLTPTSDLESGIAATLPPGLYTALLAGRNNSTGVGVVEVYDLGRAPAHLQTNLVSDLPGVASFTDPNLTNPWGIATSPTSSFWVADNRSGLSTLYDSSGAPQTLVVTVPPAPPAPGGTTGNPTGIVYNATSDFEVATGAAARFIFATEDGTISGWSQATGATAVLKVDNSASIAIYKGLAIGNNGTANYLYAANFHAGRIDVFDATYAAATLSGSFADPSIPTGYAPFNIQNLGGVLYVTYALRDSIGVDDVPGVGHGFINTFDFDGNLLGRFASTGALNSPWGLAIASAGFGAFANDLLVGNFGDGRINIFDPATGAYRGQLADGSSLPISIEGLWGLKFGNGGSGGDPNTLYFAAGIGGPGFIEDHGLFGSITP